MVVMSFVSKMKMMPITVYCIMQLRIIRDKLLIFFYQCKLYLINIGSYSGMNIDTQNKFGESALHICSGQNKNLDLAKLLIMKGANPNIKNTLGDSPLGKDYTIHDNKDLAKRYGNHDIVLLYST